MKRRISLVALMLLTAAACGGGGTPPPVHHLAGEPSTDDDEGHPFVLGAETLPPLPVTVHASDEVVSSALRLSREAVLPERPVLADDASEDDTARFMREDFQAWVIARARAIGAARNALGAMEHGEPDEYVLASAIVGTLFSMLAREVEAMPLPRIVREDRNERVLVREALLEVAAPLYRRGLDALGACASTAAGAADPTLEAWASYCDEATDRAEHAPRPVDLDPDEPPVPAADAGVEAP